MPAAATHPACKCPVAPRKSRNAPMESGAPCPPTRPRVTNCRLCPPAQVSISLTCNNRTFQHLLTVIRPPTMASSSNRAGKSNPKRCTSLKRAAHRPKACSLTQIAVRLAGPATCHSLTTERAPNHCEKRCSITTSLTEWRKGRPQCTLPYLYQSQTHYA